MTISKFLVTVYAIPPLAPSGLTGIFAGVPCPKWLYINDDGKYSLRSMR